MERGPLHCGGTYLEPDWPLASGTVVFDASCPHPAYVILGPRGHVDPWGETYGYLIIETEEEPAWRAGPKFIAINATSRWHVHPWRHPDE